MANGKEIPLKIVIGGLLVLATVLLSTKNEVLLYQSKSGDTFTITRTVPFFVGEQLTKEQDGTTYHLKEKSGSMLLAPLATKTYGDQQRPIENLE